LSGERSCLVGGVPDPRGVFDESRAAVLTGSPGRVDPTARGEDRARLGVGCLGDVVEGRLQAPTGLRGQVLGVGQRAVLLGLRVDLL